MIGIWAGVAVLVGLGFGHSGWPLVGVVGLLAFVSFQGTLPGRAARSIVVVMLLCLAALGMIRAGQVDPSPTLVDAGNIDRIDGRIVSPVQTDLRFQSAEIALIRVRAEDAWSNQTGIVRVVAPVSPELAFGDIVGLSGDLTATEDSEMSYRSYLEQQGIAGSMFARTAWIEEEGTGLRRTLFGYGSDLAERLRRAVPGDSGVLLAGLVVGDDSALSDDTTEAFRITGMSHITAVSGSNLALVVVMLMAVGSPLGLRRRWFWLLTVTVAIWLYAAVTGLEPPVVRAALMATISLFALPFGRRADYLTAAVLSAAGMAFYDPRLIDDIGFQLSLSASVALAAVAAGVSIESPARAVRLAINGSIVAQVATMPITMAAFGSVSLVSIPVNLIVGPLVGVAFPLAFLGALVGEASPMVGDAVILIAGWVVRGILLVIESFARLPFARIWVPDLTMTTRAVLIAASAVTVLLVSQDGRRWFRRLVRAGDIAPAAVKADVPR